MKKLSFLAMAAVGLMFAACSDKDEVAQETFNKYDLIEGQSAWISVGISTPGEATITRANEDLNDGIADEWTVYSAKLVLFKGPSEDEATLIKDYDITTEFSAESNDQNPGTGSAPNNAGEVSHTSTKVVKEIDAPALGGQDNLYGYVILNGNNNATGIAYTPGMKFSAFKTQVLKAIGIADEAKGFGAINSYGLVMTNVAIAAKTGGDVDPSVQEGQEVTTLALIDKNAVYTTKAAAEAGTATACIYVERAAVKVDVINNVEQVQLEGADAIDVTFNGWSLGNVNFGGNDGTGYYNTRQFDTEWLPYFNEACATSYLKWRMVGRTDFFDATQNPGHATAFRTYFGRDVNYTNAPKADGTFDATNLKGFKLADADYTLADKAVTYTYENTFYENSQIWANTTYVGVKMTLAGGDFYTIEGQPNTRLTYDATTKTGTLCDEVGKNHSLIITNARTEIETAIAADLSSATSTLNVGKEADAKITSVSFDLKPVVTLGTRSATTGAIPYTFTLKLDNVKNSINGADPTAMATDDITKLEALAGTNLTTVTTGTTTVYQYVGGVAYYSARISHFAQAETPWSAPAEAFNQYDKIYPENGKSLASGVEGEDGYVPSVNYGATRGAAWLGRWGIVRNNWYRITIDAVRGLGSPVPEDYSGEAGGTPDDNPEPKYYIQAHVHILPWVVRGQSVSF